MKTLFLLVIIVLFGLVACTDESSSGLPEEEITEEEVTNSTSQPTTNYSYTPATKSYSKYDYTGYDKIIYHSLLDISGEPGTPENRESIDRAFENIEEKYKKNPTGEQWFFIMLKYNFGYGTNKVESSATELMSCNQYSCDPEQLIMLKDQFAKQNLLAGQTLIDYQIIVIDGYYSYASDYRMEVVSGQ